MSTTMTDDEPPTPPPPTEPPLRPGRRLTRSRSDRVIGGVAGGIAHTYGWDAGLVRVIIAVAAVVTGGAIAIAYGIAWLVIPEEVTGVTGAETFRGHRMRHARESWALPVGIVLVAAGMLGVAHRFAWGPFSQLFWPITLIAGGLAVLLVRHRDPALTDEAGGAAREPHRAATVATASTAPGSTAATGSDVTPAFVTAEQPTVAAYPSATSWPTGELPQYVPPPPRPPRERSTLGRITWSSLLLLTGGAALLSATGAVDVDPGFVLALALGLVGLALVVGTWIGRSRGLIALGLALVFVCSVQAALDVPLRGGIGERIYRVTDVRDLQRHYELAIGHLVVDLTALDTAGTTFHIDARDAIGQLQIHLPSDASLDIRTRVGAGDVRLLGQPDNGGWRVDQRLHIRGNGPRFVIDARVGFGQITVDQPDTAVPLTPPTTTAAIGGTP